MAAILDQTGPSSPLARTVNTCLIALIVINVGAVVLESMASVERRWHAQLQFLETASIVIFTVEYLLRVWSSVDNENQPAYAHPLWGRLRYMRTPLALVDLLAVAPYWLSVLFPIDLRFLRALRLLRILKLTRYYPATNLLFEVVRREARVLAAAMFAVLLLVLLTASLVYIAEHEAQPGIFPHIPAAIWWAVVTVTTVGYGDAVPITAAGQLLGGFLAFVGVGLVALPAGIFASGFSDALHRRREDIDRGVDCAWGDGVIDDEELARLQAMARDYDLSDDELQGIIDAQRNGRSRCPTCGQVTPCPVVTRSKTAD